MASCVPIIFASHSYQINSLSFFLAAKGFPLLRVCNANFLPGPARHYVMGLCSPDMLSFLPSYIPSQPFWPLLPFSFPGAPFHWLCSLNALPRKSSPPLPPSPPAHFISLCEWHRCRKSLPPPVTPSSPYLALSSFILFIIPLNPHIIVPHALPFLLD